MIRTEILVENMKKQIDDIETKVTGALAKLNEDTVTWKGEIESMQDNSNTSLQLLQEKAKSVLDKNMQEMQDLKGNMFYLCVKGLINVVKDIKMIQTCFVTYTQ
jgi:hypothetical protein